MGKKMKNLPIGVEQWVKSFNFFSYSIYSSLKENVFININYF